MLDQREERDRLAQALNGGEAGWNDDEPAVVRATMDQLFREYFAPGRSGHDKAGRLIEVVSQALAAVDRPGDAAKAETLISAALGVGDQDLERISPLDRFQLGALVVSTAAGVLDLEEADVDAVLREAERLTFEQGFHPLRVPRGRAALQRP
jgi:hypothetical protein